MMPFYQAQATLPYSSVKVTGSPLADLTDLALTPTSPDATFLEPCLVLPNATEKTAERPLPFSIAIVLFHCPFPLPLSFVIVLRHCPYFMGCSRPPSLRAYQKSQKSVEYFEPGAEQTSQSDSPAFIPSASPEHWLASSIT